MSELICDPMKILKYLDEQRKTGTFCDIIIELEETGEKVYGHFCVIGVQSDFICNKNVFNSYFSIRNPLKIKIQNFNCGQCLNTIFDFFYTARIKIPTNHEIHFKDLAKLLSVTNLDTIFPETLDDFFHIDDKQNNDTSIGNNTLGNQEIVVETITENSEKVNFYRINQEEHITNSKLNFCPGCKFKCFKISEMVTHLAHCNSDNMICSLCDIGFYSADDFYVHLVNHENPKAFYCFDCDMRFTTKTALVLHTPKHAVTAQHQCSLCPKRFKWKQTLKSHYLVHLNEKRLLCDVCGYSTIHMKALKSHKLIHDKNGISCTYPECQYKSTRRENLKIHMNTHKNEQPFVCEICGKKFSQGKNYKRHALLHSDIAKRNYKCTICSFTTSRSDKLKEHINKNHRITTSDTNTS